MSSSYLGGPEAQHAERVDELEGAEEILRHWDLARVLGAALECPNPDGTSVEINVLTRRRSRSSMAGEATVGSPATSASARMPSPTTSNGIGQTPSVGFRPLPDSIPLCSIKSTLLQITDREAIAVKTTTPKNDGMGEPKGQRAALFPALSEGSKEKRAVSILLACMEQVPELTQSLLQGQEAFHHPTVDSRRLFWLVSRMFSCLLSFRGGRSGLA